MTEGRGKGPHRWQGAWVAWLLVFLAVEIPAAIRKPKNDTLSENVWIWFRAPLRRVALGIFMLALTSHFVFMWPGGLGLGITALPVVAIIGFEFLRGQK